MTLKEPFVLWLGQAAKTVRCERWARAADVDRLATLSLSVDGLVHRHRRRANI